VNDLVEWLQARFDEVERVARAATAGPWRYNPKKAWHLPADLPTRRNGEEFVGAGPLDATIGVAATGPADHPQSMADAQFIALWDPARVLAEVDAKRRLLAEHPCGDDGFCGDGIGLVGCKWAWPCPTVRLIALPDADQPGYRDEWRP
jgi:hypothetical protein